MALSSFLGRSIRVAVGGELGSSQIGWSGHASSGYAARCYLDLNHFICMARAIAADPKTPAGYGELLRARDAIEEGAS
jgi:hypothetical protein